MEDHVYLLLGSNLGDRMINLKKAAENLMAKGFQIKQKSLIYQTEAWGIKDQPNFLNRVIRGDWSGDPRTLLLACQDVEKVLGRIRNVKWGERNIDIDILYYGSEVINESDLQIPHPGIVDRKFTLVPLVEIAPDFLHPQLKKTQSSLLLACDDPGRVDIYTHL